MVSINLAGKTALITGVSRRAGIGAAVVMALAEAGADCFTTWWRPYDVKMPWGSRDEEAQAILADAWSLGVRVAGIEADLSDPAVPAGIFDAAEAALGKVSILVNNATHSEHTPIETLCAADLDAHSAVNLRGDGTALRRVCAPLFGWGGRTHHQFCVWSSVGTDARRAGLRRHQRRGRGVDPFAGCGRGGQGDYRQRHRSGYHRHGLDQPRAKGGVGQ